MACGEGATGLGLELLGGGQEEASTGGAREAADGGEGRRPAKGSYGGSIHG